MVQIVNIQSSFSSTFEKVDMEVQRILELINSNGIILGKELEFILQFALRELFNNAVEHGNKMNPSKRVRYLLNISKSLFNVEVFDCGDGFDIADIPHIEHDDMTIRHRNRGIVALFDIGFKLKSMNGRMSARLDLDSYNVIDKGMVVRMEIIVDNRTAFCRPNATLVAANVKEMVEAIKGKLDDDAEYDSMVIDLGASESIDSMGITFLIGIYKTLTGKGKTVKLTGVSDTMLNLFKIMKLDEIFEFTK